MPEYTDQECQTVCPSDLKSQLYKATLERDTEGMVKALKGINWFLTEGGRGGCFGSDKALRRQIHLQRKEHDQSWLEGDSAYTYTFVLGDGVHFFLMDWIEDGEVTYRLEVTGYEGDPLESEIAKKWQQFMDKKV